MNKSGAHNKEHSQFTWLVCYENTLLKRNKLSEYNNLAKKLTWDHKRKYMKLELLKYI